MTREQGELGSLPRIARLQVAWEDDAWLGVTVSCCAASFCAFLLLAVFLAGGTLNKNERVNCVTVLEPLDLNSTLNGTNATAGYLSSEVVQDVFRLNFSNASELWQTRLKDTWMLGGRTRLRCILGWVVMLCVLVAGLLMISVNLFARRVRVAFLGRHHRHHGGEGPAEPSTCLPWYCVYSRWLIGRPVLAVLTLVPTLDFLSDILITVQWARGQHVWWLGLSGLILFLSWRFIFLAHWWWARKVSCALSLGTGMMLWVPVAGPRLALRASGYGSIDADKIGMCVLPRLGDCLSLDRFEQYSFWLDISHSGLCLEVLAFMALPAIPIWVMSHHVREACAALRWGAALSGDSSALFLALFQSFPLAILQIRCWQTVSPAQVDGITGVLLLVSVVLSVLNMVRCSVVYVFFKDVLENSIGCRHPGETLSTKPSPKP
jgi:hypothetical protein